MLIIGLDSDQFPLFSRDCSELKSMLCAKIAPAPSPLTGTAMNPPDSRRTQHQQAPRKVRRQRAARACDRCRAKKYKCDEKMPCCHCASKSSH